MIEFFDDAGMVSDTSKKKKDKATKIAIPKMIK
jgi:hypothetical protein